MNNDQAIENSRTVASLLGLEDEQAAERLILPIQVTWETTDAGGNCLGLFVVRLLARTFHRVGSPSAPIADAAVELLINGATSVAGSAKQLHSEIDAAAFACTTLRPCGKKLRSFVPDVLCLVAACFASAQVTHYALQLPNGLVSPEGVVLDFSAWPGVDASVWQTEVNLGELQVAGGGAVGNAVLFALQLLRASAQGFIIDPKEVVPGVLNRCLYFDDTDLGKHKATALARKLEVSGSRIRLRPICRTVARSRPEVAMLSCLVVGVDSRRARRELQGELPLEVFDASTTGVEEVVFHHNKLFSDGACLACIYKEAQVERDFAAHVAELLNVSPDEVAEEFISQSAALKICERYPDLVPDDVAGKAYTTLFRQRCATGSLRTPEQKQVLAPFAFVSQLAGAILAIEMFLRRADARRERWFNYWRVSPWRNMSIELRDYRVRDPHCAVCSEQDYRDTARLVWQS